MEETKESGGFSNELHVETKKLSLGQSANLWEEIRTANQHPSRRSYHSAVIWNEKMLVYGGQDLREGPQYGLWQIEIGQFDQGDWEELKVAEKGPLCRHSAVVANDCMYLFGGSNGNQEFNKTTVVNLRNLSTKNILPESNNCPPALDSHSACLYTSGSETCMIVFGGFFKGERSSGVYILDLNSEKWKTQPTSNSPCARSNHSAVVYEDFMYVFAGTNEESEKLGDLWKLDLKSFCWEEIFTSGDAPSGRSGHSAVVYKDFMVVFGGMKDITKETNEMYSYNFSNNTWTLFQFEFHIRDPITNEQLEEYKKSKIVPAKKNESSLRSPLKKISEALSPNKMSPKKSPENSNEGTLNVSRKKKTLYDGPASPVTGRIRAHPPHPRDGHSAVVVNDIMIIFGGDRHQMPFNDTYVYFLVEETIKTPVRRN